MTNQALSRRGLLGVGLRRALGARLDELDLPVGGSAKRSWGDERSPQLGSRLAPVAELMVEMAGVSRGQTVLAAAAGNDALRRAGTARGAAVMTADSLPFSWGTASFNAVLGFFSVTAHPDPRLAASELVRVAGPGAPIVLAAWAGQPWARYETAYRHFFGFPDLDVTDHEMPEPGMEYSIVFARSPLSHQAFSDT